ncbi:MAG: peptidase M1 [Kofleriaceae bacterium]|nr:peptidase M1 [Kofleriaceae bacterium]
MPPRRHVRSLPVLLLAAATGATGCGDDGGALADAAGGGVDAAIDARPAGAVDVTATALTLDLTTRTGTAIITLAERVDALDLDVGDLTILGVSGGLGDVPFTTAGGGLHVELPASESMITVNYTFAAHSMFDGWDPGAGVTFLWPEFCGNLFPCRTDPADGSTFTMNVSGGGAGTLVYPTSIPAQAPAYMPAIALGNFVTLELGTTTAGTTVRAYHLPRQAAAAASGTAQLRQVVDFFEQTYGPYTFGDAVASVSASWGPGAYGGMEHHPYWHVAADAFDVAEIHAHEAAHGWFGNGVRIACWEDFVLSEGLATYLAARSLAEFGVDLWPEYDCALATICGEGGGTVALPSTCGAIDILTDPLWSGVPYQKGAQYLREVAAVMGEAQLDAVIAAFYQAHVGQAAEMEQLIAAIKAAAGAGASAQLDAIEQTWLRTLACPATAPVCPSALTGDSAARTRRRLRAPHF